MSRQGRLRRLYPVTERPRPRYARVLRLRRLNPSSTLCFLFLEGSIAFALLLALAELVSWWSILVLPVLVAAAVKANDRVAVAVARSAALVPEQEQERFRREIWHPEPSGDQPSGEPVARSLAGRHRCEPRGETRWWAKR